MYREFAWFSSFGKDDDDDYDDDKIDDVTMRWVIYLGWFGSPTFMHAYARKNLR